MLNGRADEPLRGPAGRTDAPSSADGEEAEGLSLERLSQAFARAMGAQPDRPAADAADTEVAGTSNVPSSGREIGEAISAHPPASSGTAEADVCFSGPNSPTAGSWPVRDIDARCPLSPRSIAEAILF